MTYQPVIPLSGYAGWRFLTNTLEKQKESYVQSPVIQRNAEYFRENIANVKTADDLVNDRRLLQVSLEAFGLGDDINSKAFIRTVLEEGTIDSDALANKLSDKRYAAMSKAFGFALGTPNTVMSDFADKILDRYQDRSFEVAVGEVDNDMRMAMNLEPALEQITDMASTNNGQWYSIMGNTAVREVFEVALGFPSSFAAIDVDQQLEQFKDRAAATFGTDQVVDFQSEETREKLIRLYMVRSEIADFSAASSGSIALTLLQGSIYG